VVGLLLKKGADINAKNAKDRTALHGTVDGNYEKIMQLFLDKGADIHAKDKTMLFMAVRSR
jgi:ankyrin repeat protein